MVAKKKPTERPQEKRPEGLVKCDNRSLRQTIEDLQADLLAANQKLSDMKKQLLMAQSIATVAQRRLNAEITKSISAESRLEQIARQEKEGA